MAYQITAKSGPLLGRSWAIAERPLVLGRSSQCEVPLPDLHVSRRHCRVSESSGQVVIEDLSSANATLLNGEVVSQRATLQAGDEITIGESTFLVSALSSEAVAHSGDALWAEDYSDINTDLIQLDRDRVHVPGTSATLGFRDIATLFACAREFAACADRRELFSALSQRISARYEAEFIALYESSPDGNPELTETWGDLAAAGKRELKRAVCSAATTRRASAMRLSFETSEFRAIVAPARMGESVPAVLAVVLKNGSPGHPAGEEFLAALSYAVGPFVVAVDRIENLRTENRALRQVANAPTLPMGESKAMRSVRGEVEKVAPTDLGVMILGETGVGKELVALMVHDRSNVSRGPFVVCNCAAIPKDLVESELFGHERGSFTGATSDRTGLIELASGGTLFLDEIGDLSLESQAKLLRVLESGTFRRIGSKVEKQSKFRLLSATSRDVRDLMVSGQFRQDFYHRISAVEIEVPPLRERKDDIPALARHFLSLGLRNVKRPIRGLSDEAMRALVNHDWQGNVRELKNCIERAVVQCEREVIGATDLEFKKVYVARQADNAPDDEMVSLKEAERRHVNRVMSACRGDVDQAANVLGIARSTLYNKLATHGIPARRNRS